MRRIFGSKKKKAPAKPAPTLDEMSKTMESRGDSIETKVSKKSASPRRRDARHDTRKILDFAAIWVYGIHFSHSVCALLAHFCFWSSPSFPRIKHTKNCIAIDRKA